MDTRSVSIDGEAMRRALQERGVTAEVVTFATIDEVLEAHASVEVGAFAASITYILDPDFLAASGVDPSIPTMWTGIGVHPLAAAVRLGETDFAAEVDEVLEDLMTDGTWLEHYRATFGSDPPYTIDEMRNVPPFAG